MPGDVTYRIAVLAGDGVGPEIVDVALKVLTKVGNKYGHKFAFSEALVGGAAYDQCGEHLPQDTLRVCKESDAIVFGAVGGPVDQQHDPKWKDVERNALLGLRKELRLAVNLRPATVYPFLSHLSPLKDTIVAQGIDMLIVRELVSGIYFGEHTMAEDGRSAYDVMSYSWEEIEKPVRFAFESAKLRRKHVTIVDKANVLSTSRLWREVARHVATEYPDIELDFMYVDNAVMQIIKNPSFFDVVATSNMFGDILSDAASMLPGSLGLMPSASLGDKIHMYEPIHGSAPDIAGMDKVNPIAMILSAAMMLRYSFSLETEAKAIENAVQQVLASGLRTGDLVAGESKPAPIGTTTMAEAILNFLD